MTISTHVNNRVFFSYVKKCMHLYMYICKWYMCAYICVCVCVCVCVRMGIHYYKYDILSLDIAISILSCSYIRMYTCMHAYTRTRCLHIHRRIIGPFSSMKHAPRGRCTATSTRRFDAKQAKILRSTCILAQGVLMCCRQIAL
jgi:hypothetical protein